MKRILGWAIRQTIYVMPTPVYMWVAGWQIEKGWIHVQLTPTNNGLLYVSIAPWGEQMIRTAYNPFYRCKSGHTWKSTPITIVLSDSLEMPECPECGAELRVLSVLEGLMAKNEYEADGREVRRDHSIASRIKQDFETEFKEQIRADAPDWYIQDRDQGVD